MKKRGILCIILVFCLAFTFIGCGTKKNVQTAKENVKTTNNNNSLSEYAGTYNLNIQGQSVPFNIKLQSDGSLFAGFDQGGASGTLKPIDGSTTKFSLTVPGQDTACTIDFSEAGKVKYITPQGAFEGTKK